MKNKVMLRYIVKELMLYFSIAFVFFFMVFFVNQILLIAEKLLKSKAPFYDVMRLLVCYFPSIIAQSAPYATFVGFLMCLGRMMSDNEILVFRASGFSFNYILVPVLALGLIISIISFFVNDYLLPLGSINATKISKEIFNATPAVELESNSVKNMKGAKIVIGNVIDHEVSDIVFFQRDKDGNDKIIVAGKTDVMNTKIDGILMQLNMSDCIVALFNQSHNGNYDVLDAGLTTMNVFDTTSGVSSSSGLNPDQMTSYDLGREIKRLQTTEGMDKSFMNAYKMVFHKKISIPFGSIFFSILAIAIAFLFGKHNGQTIGLIVGLIICVLNWAMLIMGQVFTVRNGLNAFWAMWLPDILLGSVGTILYLFVLKK